MTNKLVVGIPTNLTESINMGKVFFESGLFSDLKTAAQAVVKIQAGAELGIPAFASLSGIHIIQGKPTIGAGIIASRVKGSGKYDYRVTQNDDKACIIYFYQGANKIGTSSFTIDDAKKAGTKNLDKFPKNMLFARAISNGVKWFCPDVFSGPVYVPQEMGVEVNEAEEVIAEELPDFFKTQEEKEFEVISHLDSITTIADLNAYFKSLAPELQSSVNIKAAFGLVKNNLTVKTN